MKKYLVRTPILHNGTRFAMGATISLTAAEAASLSVHVSLLPGQAEKPKDDQVQMNSTSESALNDDLDKGLDLTLTNAQLSDLLTQRGVEHNPRSKKVDLEVLVATLDPELVEAFKTQVAMGEAQSE